MCNNLERLSLLDNVTNSTEKLPWYLNSVYTDFFNAVSQRHDVSHLRRSHVLSLPPVDSV